MEINRPLAHSSYKLIHLPKLLLSFLGGVPQLVGWPKFSIVTQIFFAYTRLDHSGPHLEMWQQSMTLHILRSLPAKGMLIKQQGTSMELIDITYRLFAMLSGIVLTPL